MKLCKHIIHIFSQIDWRKAKNEKIHRIYMTNNRNLIPPREIQAGKLDESSATKLPQGHLVWQSGQGEHSPEGDLEVKGRSPQIDTERVSVTSAKTYFFPQRLSKNGIIFINNLWMEEKQSGQAPTPLGLVCKL